MPKSPYAEAVDEIQRRLRPFFQQRGFKVRGRTFNRQTEDGTTQVVDIQMGASDPPGTTYIAGLRENLHGWFAINLGVCVPEVARHLLGVEAGAFVREYHCSVRARLGELVGEGKEIWWRTHASDEVVSDVKEALEAAGIPFLERFGTRDRILAEFNGRSENQWGGSPPRIVSAIILHARGEQQLARALLTQQALETNHSGHREYVRSLAEALGLGRLD